MMKVGRLGLFQWPKWVEEREGAGGRGGDNSIEMGRMEEMRDLLKDGGKYPMPTKLGHVIKIVTYEKRQHLWSPAPKNVKIGRFLDYY